MKIKYKDQYLTFYHYKEPLKEVEKKVGHGYYGCLLSSENGESIQCHICGKLYGELATHVRMTHKISAAEYKEQFQLNKTTALISEKIRQERKGRTLLWIYKMEKKYGTDWRDRFRALAKKGRQMRGKFQPKEMLEAKNKKGTCPDQLIAKILEVKKKLNHTPSLAEFIDETGGQRFKHLIFATFGSWRNAIKVAKLEPKERSLNYEKHLYSDDELLEYLSLYAQENNKLPTATDSKRRLIPDYAIYQRRFGTFEKARELAGVYNFIKND